jgi:hypothetical protein
MDAGRVRETTFRAVGILRSCHSTLGDGLRFASLVPNGLVIVSHIESALVDRSKTLIL